MGRSERPGAWQRPFAFLLLAACLITFALGCWQVQRRTWKHALIARVEAGLAAAPVPLPDPATWAQTDWNGQEYRRIEATGSFDFDREILVRGSSALGTGYWVMTPLRLTDGQALLVNRGFVPMGWHEARSGRSATPDHVVGLVRPSRQQEAWWRHNDPAHGIWVARDVGQLTAAMHLDHAAPFFVDLGDPRAAPRPTPPDDPVPGLTVVQFADNHLQYAITWFVLSVAALWASLRVRREAVPEPGS